jgi:tetratricopeptide (TPR) repeat protein
MNAMGCLLLVMIVCCVVSATSALHILSALKNASASAWHRFTATTSINGDGLRDGNDPSGHVTVKDAVDSLNFNRLPYIHYSSCYEDLYRDESEIDTENRLRLDLANSDLVDADAEDNSNIITFITKGIELERFYYQAERYDEAYAVCSDVILKIRHWTKTNPNEAMQSRRFRQSLGFLSCDVANVRVKIGFLGVETMQMYDSALEYFVKARFASTIKDPSAMAHDCMEDYDVEARGTSSVLADIGMYHMHRGEYARAEEYNDLSLKYRVWMYEGETGRNPDLRSSSLTYRLDHAAVGHSYVEQAALHARQGQIAESEEAYRTALDIFKETLGKGSTEYKRLCSYVQSVCD